MTSFKDSAGREWRLKITIQALRDVRAQLGFDLHSVLAGIISGEPTDDARKLFGDPIQFFDVLYVLCREQAKERVLDDVAFGQSFDAETWEAAQDAMLGALVFFSPDPHVRELKAKILAKGKAVGNLALSRAAKELEEADLEALLASVGATSKKESGAAPAKSASTPAPSLSTS